MCNECREQEELERVKEYCPCGYQFGGEMRYCPYCGVKR